MSGESGKEAGCIVFAIGCVAFVAWIAYTGISELGFLEFMGLAWKLMPWEIMALIALMWGLTVMMVWLDAREFRRLMREIGKPSKQEGAGQP